MRFWRWFRWHVWVEPTRLPPEYAAESPLKRLRVFLGIRRHF